MCMCVIFNYVYKITERTKEKDFEEQNHEEEDDLSDEGPGGTGEHSQHHGGLHQLENLQEFEEVQGPQEVQPEYKMLMACGMPIQGKFDVNGEEGEKVGHIQQALEEFLLIWAGKESQKKFKHKPEDAGKF